jgi:hypothetical protein
MPIFLGNQEIALASLGSLPVSDILRQNPTISRELLVAYYDASITSSYPGTGTTWYDISGNNLNMTAISSSTFPIWDGSTYSFNFNGTNAAIISTNNAQLLSQQTQVIWVKTGKTGNVNNGIYAGVQNNVGGGINGRWDGESYGNQGTGWSLASSNADRPLSSGVTETTSEYIMISAVRDGTNYKIYKNNASLIAETNQASTTYTNGMLPYVGSNFLNNQTSTWGTAWFSGSLSMFLIYNKPLTADEIRYIYSLGRV